MTELTVIEVKGEGIAREIARRISERNSDRAVFVTSVSSSEELLGGDTDILVVSPGSAESECVKAVRCKILLLPDGKSAGFADAGCVVTYGMCPRNTLTMSSIEEKRCVLAVQRELVTIFGDVLDRQELIMRGGRQTDSLLAIAGALLLAGGKPIV